MADQCVVGWVNPSPHIPSQCLLYNAYFFSFSKAVFNTSKHGGAAEGRCVAEGVAGFTCAADEAPLLYQVTACQSLSPSPALTRLCLQSPLGLHCLLNSSVSCLLI
uniref:Uncharacterized protein n=1 Tax=Knipowitschia caucasica TaxID=637954 RepID=A0AAV2JEM7_KNICA